MALSPLKGCIVVLRQDRRCVEVSLWTIEAIRKGFCVGLSRRLSLVSNPRWNGNLITFNMQVNGKPVACAISGTALQQLTVARHVEPTDLLRSFMDARDRIQDVAARLFAFRPEGVTGTLRIWVNDLDDPPTAPAVARHAGAKMRPELYNGSPILYAGRPDRALNRAIA